MQDVTRIFLSCSPDDRLHAERLSQQFLARGYQVSDDPEGTPSKGWMSRLRKLIEGADAVVFLLSPTSAASETCAWAVEVASELGKRIAPIVVADVDGSAIPPRLASLGYIFATEADRFDNAVASLCDALSVTAKWRRDYRRLTERALHWSESDDQRGTLLGGAELASVRDLLTRRPSEVSEIAYVVELFVLASEGEARARSDYADQRLRALDHLVRPLIEQRVQALKAQIAAYEAMPTRHWNATIMQMNGEIEAICNFSSDAGRWHPKAAVHERTLGADGDYCEIYRFPCCNRHTSLNDPGAPHQFRYDGCQEQPRL